MAYTPYYTRTILPSDAPADPWPADRRRGVNTRCWGGDELRVRAWLWSRLGLTTTATRGMR